MNNLSEMKKYLLILAISFFFVILPAHAAIDYHVLEPLPYISSDSGTSDVSSFIPGIVKIAILVAGALAVIRIIIGGVQYMSTDAWGKKSDAKGTITSALMGLLLAIGSYTILYTINPNLLKIQQTLSGVESTITDVTTSGQATAEELGCKDDCQTIDAGLVTVSPGACSNTPCYLKGTMYSPLIGPPLNSLPRSDGSGRIYWQVTKAFPQVNTTNECYKANGANAGQCVEVALSNPANASVVDFVNALQDKYGDYFRFYNACPAARVASLKAAPGIDATAANKIVCSGSGAERAGLSYELGAGATP